MENQKKQREKSKQLKSKSFNLSSIIQLSFIISLFTHILFIYILTSPTVPHKFIGILLHISLSVTIALSLKSSLHNNLSKYAHKLNLYMKLLLLFLVSLLVYYVTLINALSKSEDTDNNTILFFIFSITISGMFHGLLLFAISSFVSQILSKTTNGTLSSSSLQQDDAIKETMIRSDTLN